MKGCLRRGVGVGFLYSHPEPLRTVGWGTRLLLASLAAGLRVVDSVPVVEGLLFRPESPFIALDPPGPLVKDYYAYVLVFAVLDDSSDHISQSFRSVHVFHKELSYGLTLLFTGRHKHKSGIKSAGMPDGGLQGHGNLFHGKLDRD